MPALTCFYPWPWSEDHMTLTESIEPLKRLEFLIGHWKSRAEDQFGEKGVIESSFECSHEPSDKFIATIGESRSNGKLVNKGSSFLIWDSNVGKYVRKSFYSYGWVLNEVGIMNGDRLIFDVVSIDGEPDDF